LFVLSFLLRGLGISGCLWLGYLRIAFPFFSSTGPWYLRIPMARLSQDSLTLPSSRGTVFLRVAVCKAFSGWPIPSFVCFGPRLPQGCCVQAISGRPIPSFVCLGPRPPQGCCVQAISGRSIPPFLRGHGISALPVTG